MRKREILVAGLIACSTATLIVYFTVRPDVKRARCDLAAVDVRAIESAAMVYVSEHSGECPTIQDLKHAGILEEPKPTTDPWNTEFRIVCDVRRATATSAGPDKQFDTEDDISVPATGR
jgi:hypothetical protein